MKFEIGDIVIDNRTGEIATVFDYAWLDADSISINLECDAVMVKTSDFGLEIWPIRNVSFYKEESIRQSNFA